MPRASSADAILNYERTGSGDPLVLLHGTGSSLSVWNQVLGELSAVRDVIAVDLPGHGASPVAPESVAPTPIGYARVLSDFLGHLDMDVVDVAGNSVGAWTALELAKLGRARSVVALGPAGLWPKRSPWTAYVSLWLMHHAPTPPPPVLRSPIGRLLAFGMVSAHPSRIPFDEALRAARGIKATRQFDDHLRRTTRTRFTGGAGITVPVTVAFGERDRLVPRRARCPDELPAHTRWLTLPACGHVPMWDDPSLTARTILEATSAGASRTTAAVRSGSKAGRPT